MLPVRGEETGDEDDTGPRGPSGEGVARTAAGPPRGGWPLLPATLLSQLC